jgi:hypothetical protein
MKANNSWIVLVVIAVVAWGLQKGWGYQTGQQWFNSCWMSVNGNNRPPFNA